MNLSVLPDFLSIGGLLTVFASLLKRTRQTRLRYWLVGWVMILVHIVAQLALANLGDGFAADTALAISLSMLLLTSVAFLWAGNDVRPSWSHELWLTLLAAAPDVAFFVCDSYDVATDAPYLLCTALGAASTAWLVCGGRRGADRRELGGRLLSVIVVYTIQAAFVLRGSIDAALNWMLFWHYLAVAFFFYRGSPRATVGVVFTTACFIGWAAVFPVSSVFADWIPRLGIQDEAWNLPKFLVATGMIFTLLEEQIGLAEHASLHDALTGLPNRRVFVRRLDMALRRARNTAGRVAVLVIDLNGFKRINDSLGHSAGDTLLQFVAQRLQTSVRSGDTLARLGGDEFAAILPDVPDRAAAEAVVDKLSRALEASTEFQGSRLCVSASIGLALYPEDGFDQTRLYASADRAMYASKLREQLAFADVALDAGRAAPAAD